MALVAPQTWNNIILIPVDNFGIKINICDETAAIGKHIAAAFPKIMLHFSGVLIAAIQGNNEVEPGLFYFAPINRSAHVIVFVEVMSGRMITGAIFFLNLNDVHIRF